MLKKDLFITLDSIWWSNDKKNQFRTETIHTVINSKSIFNIYQVGTSCLTYLPNLLTKFLNLADIKYNYVWNTFNNFYYDNPYVYQTKQFTTKMMALDIPLNSAYNYIIWCHPLDNLKNFISDLLKVNQYYISYYIHCNNFKLIIPFLSNNGITFQVYSILPKKPYNVKEDYYESMRMETKKLFSNKYKKYFEKNWLYRYDMDMLITYHTYNFLIEDMLKNKSVYSQINNDGVGVYNINQTFDQLALAVLSESVVE